MTPAPTPRALALALLLTAAATACVRSSAATPRPGTGAAASESAPIAGQWNAGLESVNGSGVGGSALVTHAASSGGTSVTLMVTGAPPNGSHPWHIHSGRCGESGGSIVGQPSAYTPVQIGADGTGRAQVTLPFPIPSTGDFRVNVHRSASDMGTIVACGNLSPM